MNTKFDDLELADVLKKSKSIRLPNECGIYFLIRDRQIVYVGQTTWFMHRLRTHINDESKEFNRFYFVQLPIELLNEAERHFILKFKPQYNHVKLGAKSSAPVLYLYNHNRVRHRKNKNQKDLFMKTYC